MPPDEPNDEEMQEKLEEDYDTPFRPAEPSRDPDYEPDDDAQPEKDLDDTHPSTDSNLQPEELYEGGISDAAEAEEPKRGNDVISYNPGSKEDESGK